MFIALSTAGLLAICASPLLWLSLLSFLLFYTSKFNPVVLIFCVVLLSLLLATTFISSCLSKSTQVFALIQDKLCLLLCILALNLFFSSNEMLINLFDYCIGYQELTYIQLLSLVSQSLSLAGLSFLILIALSLFLELSFRIVLSGNISIHESVYGSLRTAAIVALFTFSASQVLDFFIRNLLQV